MPTTRSARRYVAASVVSLGLLGSACASVSNPLAGLTTARAVGESLGNLLDQPGIRAQISLGVTPSQLRQLAQQSGGGAVPPAVFNGVSATSVVIDLHTLDGRNLSRAVGQTASSTKVAVDISLRLGSDTPVELRFIDKSIYARLDVAKAYADYGQSPQKASAVDQALGKADSYLPGIGALAQHKWISADLSPLAKLAQPATPAKAQTARTLVHDFESALRSNTTFTNSGTSGGRTEYTISVAARGFVTQFLDGAVQALSASLPSAALKALPGLASKIPASQQITVQEYVKGNKAEELDLDIAQFDRKLLFPVPVKVVLSTGATVAAPSGATPVDISKLGSLLSSVGSMTSTSTSPALQMITGGQMVPNNGIQVFPSNGMPGTVSGSSAMSIPTTAAP